MNDPVPVHDNRLAVIVGRVLHPFLLPIPTLLIILSGLPIGELLGWFALVIGMILVPGMIATALMECYVDPSVQAPNARTAVSRWLDQRSGMFGGRSSA